MCRVLKISESGYYRWLRNREKKNGRQLLLVRIKSIIAEHPDNDNYGVRRIHIALMQCGIEVSLRTVYRTMSEAGLLHKVRRPHGITKATTEIQDRENLIKSDFSSETPYTKLLTDITEVPCSDGKLYVSPIMDCCSGEILSLEMRDNMRKELCIDTVRSLCRQYKLSESVILHSDRGSQYLSIKYTERLAEAGIEPSVGSVGDSYDNALAETINGLFKAEVVHRRGPWRSFEAVEYATLEWVDWFNNRRLLEPIRNIPPAEAEANFYAALETEPMAA